MCVALRHCAVRSLRRWWRRHCWRRWARRVWVGGQWLELLLCCVCGLAWRGSALRLWGRWCRLGRRLGGLLVPRLEDWLLWIVLAGRGILLYSSSWVFWASSPCRGCTRSRSRPIAVSVSWATLSGLIVSVSCSVLWMSSCLLPLRLLCASAPTRSVARSAECTSCSSCSAS